MRRLWWLAAVAALLALTLGLAACGDDGGGEDEEAVRAAVLAFVDAENANAIDAWLNAISDEHFEDVIGFPITKEEARQELEAGEFALNDPPVEDFEILDIRVSGDTAEVDARARSGKVLFNQTATLVRQGETWLFTDFEDRKVDTPEGATGVDMSLVEFAFNLTQLSYPAGDVAFQVRNDGQQPHEMGIAKVPEGVSIEEALQVEDLAEVGGEEIAFFNPIEPGSEATWTVVDLEPGHYIYACFVPDANDPEGTPHAFKGMTGEFTVE